MPALKDEMAFLADGFIRVDPAAGLREKAQAFVRSRQWSTTSILYGDQKEEPEPEDAGAASGWSITFGLGLDHIHKTTADWFSDITAIVEFLQPIAKETESEFIIEFRLSSKLWYSETLAHIGCEPGDKVNLEAVHNMLQHLTKPRRNWLQKLFGR